MAAEKLEDQLLKLKEQREILKGQGHKHEDNIMKENAKLQVNDLSMLCLPCFMSCRKRSSIGSPT